MLNFRQQIKGIGYQEKKNSYKKRQWKPPSKKEEGGKNLDRPKPEGHEGMPLHQHCPPAERRPKGHQEDKHQVFRAFDRNDSQ
jgi:hypothetical protein